MVRNKSVSSPPCLKFPDARAGPRSPLASPPWHDWQVCSYNVLPAATAAGCPAKGFFCASGMSPCCADPAATVKNDTIKKNANVCLLLLTHGLSPALRITGCIPSDFARYSVFIGDIHGGDNNSARRATQHARCAKTQLARGTVALPYPETGWSRRSLNRRLASHSPGSSLLFLCQT
jgi:hypothetical protein